MHTWMDANLTEVTVGGLYGWSSGVTARQYWTLTFASGAEILVCCPDGTSIYRNDLYDDLDTRESNWHQPLLLAFAPQGGFEAALAATIDPDTSAFVEHIVTTQGLLRPSKAIAMLYWRNGGGSHQLHVIEDQFGGITTLVFTLSRAGAIGTDYMGTAIFSDQMFAQYPSSDPLFYEFGYVYVGANNTASPNKTIHIFGSCAWRTLNDERSVLEPSMNTLPFSGDTGPAFDQIAAGRYPFATPANKDWAAELWLPSGHGMLQCNPALIRLTGQNNPRFNQTQGDDTDHNFIKHIQRFLTPWDHSQTPPT
jgi:hypothetical protein